MMTKHCPIEEFLIECSNTIKPLKPDSCFGDSHECCVIMLLHFLAYNCDDPCELIRETQMVFSRECK